MVVRTENSLNANQICSVILLVRMVRPEPTKQFKQRLKN